jgi:hypothetical protein
VKLLSASKLELGKACAAAFGLPWRNDRTADSDAGTANHADKEARIIAGDYPEALVTTFPSVETWVAETKLAYNIATGEARILGHGNDRKYDGCDVLEMPGTCDVYGVDADGELVVVDWKLKRFTRIQDNLQLRWYALALCRVLGKDHATIVIFPEVGAPQRCELDALDFDAFAFELRELALAVNAAVQSDAPVYNVGGQCRNCPAILACPEQKKLVTLVEAGSVDTQIEMMMPLGSDEGAAYAYDFVQRLQLITKRLSAAVYARAAERPIPLANGMMLGKVVEEGNDKLDGDIVYDVIKAKHGQSIADAAVVRSATKKRLKEALSLAGGKGQVASMERAVIDEVRAKGGIENKLKEAIREYPAQRQLKVAQ